MLGIAFAGQGMSQVSKSFERWIEGRNAAGIMKEVMERCVGGKKCGKQDVELNDETYTEDKNEDEENGGKTIGILPEYNIDVLGEGGTWKSDFVIKHF